jgi:hypothetical protein
MIKKYSLILAVVLALCSFGIAGAAQIDGLQNAAGPNLPIADDGFGATDNLHVYVNPSGFGDALIYGYYNVRDNNVNYFQIVNTDTVNGKVVKVRFREAKTIKDACGVGVDCGSREVLDFIVCLSKGDVWTAAVTGFGAGPAQVCAIDPDVDGTHFTLTGPQVPACSKGGQPFATQITPTVTITADQTKEGYFEVLAYGNWGTTSCAINGRNATGNAGNDLMGINYLQNDVTGMTYTYKATALADWNTVAVNPQTTGAEEFNLTNGTDNFWAPNVLTSLFAVDYVLTRSELFGTYLIDTAFDAETEMVVTFPTKMLNQLYPTTLFDDPQVGYNVWDTAENTITPQAGFSPSFTPTNQLPHEVNVINLYNDAGNDVGTTIFTSDVQGNLDATTFGLGWLGIDLTPSTSCTSGTSADATVSCTRYGGLFAGGAGQGVTALSAGLPSIGYVFQNVGGVPASFPMGYKVNTVTPGTLVIAVP